ncbi:MAG: phage integrase SAM-like domain-containing protein [Phycisphaerae bacterium]|nr:phage integrase SAM-like domain-containing protein [Phycisphaerae bacterium]
MGRQDVKEATATVYGHTQRNLLAFGESKRLDEISPGDSDNFRVHLKTQQELAENTVRRRMGIAKQFFRAAARKKIIAENPFDGQPTLVRENPKRFYFISREEAEAVLDACPDAQWRLVFALCRYGGLRCGSEVAWLKWEDVNWEKMRFTVYSSKTEHHADAGIRVMPIFQGNGIG